MNDKIAILILAFGFALTTACTQAKNDSNSAGGVIQQQEIDSVENQVILNIANNVIVPTYKGLSDSTALLRDQVHVLESDRTQENLTKAQNLWKQSRLYWESTEAFLFGPVESLSVDPMIDTWPLNRSDLNAILISGFEITPEVLRSLGTNLKGFHTAEYLLFGDGLTTNQKSINALTDREIQYLKATAIVLAEDTLKLTNAWIQHSDPDDQNSMAYVELLTKPGFSNVFYNSKQAVIAEFINGMIGIADEVGSGKIADPLGGSLADANPAAEESPFSWNSVSDFSNNIRSLRMMYTGQSPTGTGVGIKTLLERRDPVLAMQVSGQIDLAIQKIQDISSDGTPFGKAILNEAGRARVLSAQLEVNNLFTLLKQKVLPLLQ